MNSRHNLKEAAFSVIFRNADALRASPGALVRGTASPQEFEGRAVACLAPDASAYECLLWAANYGTREQITAIPDRVRAIVTPPDPQPGKPK